MIQLALVFVVSFVNIGLRAKQQINVIHDHKFAVIPTSIGMAFCEVFLVSAIVVHDATIGLALAIGRFNRHVFTSP